MNKQKENGMEHELTIKNETDDNGNPTGGSVECIGLKIDWQYGPLGREPNRKDSNGAFVEDAINASISRLQFYNAGKFRCRENSCAITHLEEALHWLRSRTQRRETSGIEGTHKRLSE